MNHSAPDHYVGGRRIEPLHVAEDWGWAEDAYKYAMLKYLSRLGRKGSHEDHLADVAKIIVFAKLYMDLIKKKGAAP